MECVHVVVGGVCGFHDLLFFRFIRKEITTTLSANCSMFLDVLVLEYEGAARRRQICMLASLWTTSSYGQDEDKVSLFLN